MTKKMTRTRAEAKKLMWEYYRDNRQSIPSWISQYREDLILKLRNGSSVRGAFLSLTENEECDTAQLR
jgi:hypothetical protein